MVNNLVSVKKSHDEAQKCFCLSSVILRKGKVGKYIKALVESILCQIILSLKLWYETLFQNYFWTNDWF